MNKLVFASTMDPRTFLQSARLDDDLTLEEAADLMGGMPGEVDADPIEDDAVFELELGLMS